MMTQSELPSEKHIFCYAHVEVKVSYLCQFLVMILCFQSSVALQ